MKCVEPISLNNEDVNIEVFSNVIRSSKSIKGKELSKRYAEPAYLPFTVDLLKSY